MPIAIDKPSSYFNTVTYAGNSSTNNISVGFEPDFVWIKNRTGAFAPYLSDSVRGAYKILFSNITNAEYDGTSNSDGVSAFTSTGFTLLNGVNKDNYNITGSNYVSWNWRGSDSSAVSNTQGSITSTVSANTISGFSIVSYTSNGTSGATVGHGLGVAPSMIIVKRRSSAEDWGVGHKSLGWTKFIRLNTTGGEATSTGLWNDTAPSSTVVTLGNSGISNVGSGTTMIMYCFAEVKGFSKAFSYTGNGSTDGTFIYTGMRPAWIMIKRTDTTGYSWAIYNTKTSTYNASTISALWANLSDAEGSYSTVDILSNGFKIRDTSATINASGGTYIGFAIAEQPFVSSKGIVANAR